MRPGEDNLKARSRMVVPKKRTKEALTPVQYGPAGVHVGRMKTIKKVKARFWRPGLTKEVHQYRNGCLMFAKCKSRPKPRAPLLPIPSGNSMQIIHINIVRPLPRSRRGNRVTS